MELPNKKLKMRFSISNLLSLTKGTVRQSPVLECMDKPILAKIYLLLLLLETNGLG